jgi:hypothetical protein
MATVRPVFINASSVAALMGHNKWVPLHEVVKQAWKRGDRSSYTSALDRNDSTRVQTDKETAKEMIRFLTSSDDEDDETSITGFVRVHAKSLNTETNTRQRVKDLMVMTRRSFSSSLSSSSPSSPKELMRSSIMNDKHLSGLVEDAIVSMVQTMAGKQREAQVVATYDIKSNNNELVRFEAVPGVFLCCMCDGFKDGKLVEIKNREKYFYMPMRDKIQTHVYMRAFRIDSSLFIQRRFLPNESVEDTTSSVSRSDLDRYWETSVEPRLKWFQGQMLMLWNSDDFQDAFLTAPDILRSDVFSDRLSEKTKTESSQLGNTVTSL